MTIAVPRAIPLVSASLCAAVVLSACGATSNRESSNQRTALALAQQMLSSAVLPASSQRLATSAPVALEKASPMIDARTSVDLHSLWRVPLSVAGFNSFASAHRPAATTPAGSSTGGVDGTAPNGLDWSYRHPPAGISSALLVYSFVPLHSGSSALRIDADVVWLPDRTRATLVSTSDRSATISVQSLAPAVGKRSLTLGPGAQLRALITLINGLKTVPPPGPISCAMSTTTVLVTFRSRFGDPPNATATQTVGCFDLGLRLGHSEILLWQGPLLASELSLLQLTEADLYGPGS